MVRTRFFREWFVGAYLATALGGHAFGQSVVVPNTNATVTGNDTSGSLVGSIPVRLQIVIDPSQFPEELIYVTGFTFRAAPGTGAVNLGVSGTISLSTSPNWPNSTGHPLLSITFANNVGPDNTLVLSASNLLIHGAACANPGPCPFANNIVFTTPFRYNPANGPLLIDAQATSFGGPGPGQMDVIDCPNTSCVINSVFATPLGSTTGSLNSGNSITQLTYTPASTVSSVTYHYTGTPFNRCNGAAPVSGTCPANYASDYVTASLTFSAPLGANLSSVNEAASPSLIAWTIGDALGYAAFSSSDANAAAELTNLSLSTDSSGNIVAWTIQAGNLVQGISGAEFYLFDPTVIGGGTGLPLADAFQVNGATASNLGNSIPGQWAETLNTLPAFFTGQVSLGSGVYYLQFSNGNLFGYYNFPSFPFLYHYDLGFEYFFDGGNGAVYMYDFSSGHWFYTSSGLFPYLYDFTLGNWLYYLPATNNPGHYTSNPRYFSDLTTGKIITM